MPVFIIETLIFWFLFQFSYLLTYYIRRLETHTNTAIELLNKDKYYLTILLFTVFPLIPLLIYSYEELVWSIYTFNEAGVIHNWMLEQNSSFLPNVFINWTQKYFTLNPTNCCLAMLTILISFLLILWIWDQNKEKLDIVVCIFLTQFSLLNVFLTTHVLWFFINFETSAIPLIYLIGIHGPTFRKIKAFYYFIGYTMLGSAFLLTGIIALFLKTNSFFYFDYFLTEFSSFEKTFLWWCFFIGFSVKIPLMPVHLWLLEAHVEAPTVGSVILASLLLKVGGYGILLFCFKLFPYESQRWASFVFFISFFSLLVSTANMFMQVDIKRSIAYSSIAHMSFSLMSLFSFNQYGVIGFILSMLSHGLTSAGLFFLAGILYKAYGTKNILYYGGLSQVMPLFSYFFLFFCFSNGAFPGTFNFISEIFMFLGLVQKSLFLTGLSLILTSFLFIYFVFFAIKINFGELNSCVLSESKDLTINQIIILGLLTILIIILGIFSESLIVFLESNIM